jgi:hypothetical protein
MVFLSAFVSGAAVSIPATGSIFRIEYGALHLGARALHFYEGAVSW